MERQLWLVRVKEVFQLLWSVLPTSDVLHVAEIGVDGRVRRRPRDTRRDGVVPDADVVLLMCVAKPRSRCVECGRDMILKLAFILHDRGVSSLRLTPLPAWGPARLTVIRTRAPSFLQSPSSISLSRARRSRSGSRTSSNRRVRYRSTERLMALSSKKCIGTTVSVGTTAGLAGFAVQKKPAISISDDALWMSSRCV